MLAFCCLQPRTHSAATIDQTARFTRRGQTRAWCIRVTVAVAVAVARRYNIDIERTADRRPRTGGETDTGTRGTHHDDGQLSAAECPERRWLQRQIGGPCGRRCDGIQRSDAAHFRRPAERLGRTAVEVQHRQHTATGVRWRYHCPVRLQSPGGRGCGGRVPPLQPPLSPTHPTAATTTPEQHRPSESS